MTPIQNLYYAIGELAYAVAFADGKIQKEEREKFHDIVAEELRSHDSDFDISDIIFKMLERDKRDSESVYQSAIHQIRLNSHYMSPGMKEKFVSVMEKIAEAYPMRTEEERNMIQQFKADMEPIKGDPVFYEMHYN